MYKYTKYSNDICSNLSYWRLKCGSVSLKVWCESPDADRTYQGDFVRFGNVLDRVMDKCNTQVQYNCSAACRIGVEIVISTPRRTEVIVYRRTWTNHKRFGKPRSRRVHLVFPPAVLYRRDFFVRRPLETCNVVLRAWMVHLFEKEIGDNHDKGYDQSLARTSMSFRTLPLSERPAYPQTRSVSWGAWLMWQLTKDIVKKCPHESGGNLTNRSKCCRFFPTLKAKSHYSLKISFMIMFKTD